jgi:hypothetical protein
MADIPPLTKKFLIHSFYAGYYKTKPNCNPE